MTLRRVVLWPDAALCRGMRRLPHLRSTDHLLAATSRATDHAAAWIAFGAAGARIDRDRADAWVAATFTVVAAEHASVLVKRATGRPRPRLVGLRPLATTPSPLSFPSSHTASAVAAAMVFGKLLPPGPLWAWAVVTGVSRPYLGVHYPSDVLAGAVLGRLIGQVGEGLVRAALGPSAARPTGAPPVLRPV